MAGDRDAKLRLNCCPQGQPCEERFLVEVRAIELRSAENYRMQEYISAAFLLVHKKPPICIKYQEFSLLRLMLSLNRYAYLPCVLFRLQHVEL